MVNKKNVIIAIMILSVIIVAGCSTTQETVQEDNTTQNENGLVPEITSDVVATVNGEEIRTNEVSSMQQSLQQQGLQATQQDALEELINQAILAQEVAKQQITITTQEAETLMETQLAQQGATLEQYKQQIQAQGIQYENQLEVVKEQLKVQRFLENAIQTQDFEVTDEEANEFYELYTQQSPEEVLPFEELEEQIITTLQQQKQQEAISSLIGELRSEANVEYK